MAKPHSKEKSERIWVLIEALLRNEKKINDLYDVLVSEGLKEPINLKPGKPVPKKKAV